MNKTEYLYTVYLHTPATVHTPSSPALNHVHIYTWFRKQPQRNIPRCNCWPSLSLPQSIFLLEVHTVTYCTGCKLRAYVYTMGQKSI